jgi:hypothetical protein
VGRAAGTCLKPVLKAGSRGIFQLLRDMLGGKIAYFAGKIPFPDYAASSADHSGVQTGNTGGFAKG